MIASDTMTASRPREAAPADERHRDLANRHPCLGGTAHGTSGRMHLPVSPACNIQCRFCRRAFNRDESRPGVTGRILRPTEAIHYVARALELCPAITVVGIAGPGDTLATDHAVQAFRLIDLEFPRLIKCLSTNGLRLEEKVGALVEAGVSTVTVTVNGVDPEVVGKIVSRVVDETGRVHHDERGAALLIERQLAGIRSAHASGIFIKINMVLVPGINDGHVAETAAAVKEAGASMLNLIPLIPQHELAHVPEPDFKALFKAQRDAEIFLPIFRHCRRCRADACGIPGQQDFAAQLYGGPLAAQTFSHG
jgi:nitrogen fixation protein NifB